MTAAVTTARGLFDRVFPRGAIVLSVLSLAFFGMGIIRNRVFANVYGASAELDAYNLAFRIPEIALDVLVLVLALCTGMVTAWLTPSAA